MLGETKQRHSNLTNNDILHNETAVCRGFIFVSFGFPCLYPLCFAQPSFS